MQTAMAEETVCACVCVRTLKDAHQGEENLSRTTGKEAANRLRPNANSATPRKTSVKENLLYLGQLQTTTTM